MTLAADILIVDADPAAIGVLAGALRGLGTLHFATGGREALAMLAERPFDLVLLDANMPDLDGFATCQALQHDYPQLPVLFVTAVHDLAAEVRALQMGARDFLTKPVSPPVVRARVSVHLQLKVLYDRLHTLSNHDPLTGVANRRALDERVAQEWRRAARHDTPLGLLMIDIDHFKLYNDHYGHLEGDECLRQVACVLGSTVTRAGELVARYGGEEFAVLLPGSNTATAAALAGKVRAAVNTLAIPHACSDAASHVTISLGVASVRPAAPRRAPDTAPGSSASPAEVGLHLARDLFDQADRALFAAKAAGRNQLSVSDGRRPARTSAAPLALVWSSRYACGHPVIDGDHRELLRQANALMQLALTEPPPATLIAALEGLLAHIKGHFGREEALLLECGYPGVESHGQLHRQLITRAEGLLARAGAGELAFGDLADFLVKEVVLRHLLRDDRDFFGWARQVG